MPIKVGESLPAVEVQEEDPGRKVNMNELFQGEKGVLFAVPGAFTPGCSQTHLPGIVQKVEELRAKGVQEVACVSVNDAFVMAAWGREHGTRGKVRMLADPTGTFTAVRLHWPTTLITIIQLTGGRACCCRQEVKAVDLFLDNDELVQVLGNKRSKRYAMVVEGGVVKKLNVEPDGTGLSCSLASNILSDLL
ncbi:peroxiredoxin-5, mitochondrial isoform X1 [Brachyhypopomus gauderio]|uniref:peroxiredoxin-5, mitochondrial isoform X1 n=1 Tax=Brachyhypopomus gauderio TaxID=698409 RepID=UPI0040431D1E